MSRGRHTAPSLTATATATRPRFGEAWTPRPALVTTFAPQPVPQREPRSWEVVRRPSEKVYRPGLDGLRAIAVIGVLLYHAGVSWMPGGLLGVDLFFVISGFLITSLLVAELQRSGSIAMIAFYRRRARRLLPALAAVLAFTLVGMALVRPGDLVRFGSDVLASIGYVTNWWFVVQHRSYFVASGRPSPFQHLWSLAVEEQFYILWPLALLVLWRVLTRAKSLAGARGRTASRSLARIGRYAVGAACISAGWMAYIAVRENLPYGADTSRVYFGTDTHASGLLLGVAAAAFLAAWYGPLWQQRPGRMGRAAFDLAGTAALAAAGWAMFRTNEFSPGLYRGGFLAFAAAAAVAVTAISRPGAVLEKVLGSKPARWVGTRSYGLYLWHWPVFVYTRPQLDVPLTGTANVLLRLALTVALAETSFRLVEQPIRTLGLRTWLQQVLHHAQTTARGASIRQKAARWPWRRALASGTMLAGLLLGCAGVLLLGYAVFRIQAPPAHRTSILITPSGSRGTSALKKGNAPSTPTARPAPTASPSATSTVSPLDAAAASPPAAAPGTSPATPSATATTSAAPPPTPTPSPSLPPLPDGHKVTAIGDSVMLGAVTSLAQALPGATVNAVEGRQASGAFTLLDGLIHGNRLGADLVLHIGTNGTIDPRALDSLLSQTANRQVVILNLHVPRAWQDLNNTILAAAARNHPDVRLLDWNAAASAHPEWLYDDGIHLRPAGAAAYRDLILNALRHGG